MVTESAAEIRDNGGCTEQPGTFIDVMGLLRQIGSTPTPPGR